ncbi:Mrp/NBP35 family ATP-binding protein [Aureibacter tunicatorum]|uniref:Iron-sulfur cluster carrier protein n=1 Tax=Aureibacter tunicatorum TaxID=866807 RepID=A0AAE4BSP1_9BACT|nr:Mrp/NBP35 family ATP-binding protein [Aureibacter tunicatorum]MDR6239065.1 ATP-binding protein involved in chromosome partitioning [Aureibacter tunicatorum]BDD05009.1 iron-sulfur cluster carrier protein [Aureibacter tunicatorum]
MNISKEIVLKALSKVQDPDLHKDLVTLGMIEKIEVSDEKVSFSVVLTTPACPLKEKIKNDCIEAVREEVGNPDLVVEPFMTSNVTSIRDNSPVLPDVKNIIAIASGKGGVGKSTVSANLAVALAKGGAKVGLIDADIYGPSMPTMFNCEMEYPEVKKEGDKSIIIPVEQYGVKIMSIGFLTGGPDNAVIWRGPMANSALKQFITDTEWGELDYLLIDLPPGTGDIHLGLVQTVPVTGAVIVTTPQKVALMDARKGVGMFKQPQINVPILGIVENMAYFTPEELPDNKYYIFGKDGGQQLAENHEVPFLGQIPLVQNIRESGDNGYPAVLKDDVTANAFRALGEEVARQVAIRNANVEATKKVEFSTH